MKKVLLILLCLMCVSVVGCQMDESLSDFMFGFPNFKDTSEDIETKKNTEDDLKNSVDVLSGDETNIDDDEKDEKDVAKDNTYIFSDSSTKEIERSELVNLSLDELEKAKNEIFARHGHDFSSKTLKEYFEGKSWYKAETGKKVAVSDLNYIEQVNVESLNEVINGKNEIKTKENVLSYEELMDNWGRQTIYEVNFIDFNTQKFDKSYNKKEYVSFNGNDTVIAYLVKQNGQNVLYFVSDGSIKLSNGKSLFADFNNCKQINGIKLLDTSNVTNMSYMFCNCSSLTSLDLTNFDTSRITDMSYMFFNCNRLKSLDLTNFYTSNQDKMNYIFRECSDLISIRLGKNFHALVGEDIFRDINNLEAVIQSAPHISINVGTFNLLASNGTILYVPTTLAEAMIEADGAYEKIFGKDNISPILELQGDSIINLKVGDKYKDAGVTVAGMGKNADAKTYTPYKYTVSGPVIKKNGTTVSSINTSSTATYTLTYTLHEPNSNVDGMSVTRVVYVGNVATLMEREEYNENYVIGAKRAGKTKYTSDKIKTITLQDNLKAPQKYVDTWDVSEKQDGSVKAWVVKNSTDSNMYDLYIGGRGGINAPAQGCMLFGGYTKCTKINNLSVLNTSSTTTMRAFFYKLYKLESIDLSNFYTARCTEMWDMFNDCQSLKTIDISNFDTSKLKDTTYMFYNCKSLTNIDVTKFEELRLNNFEGMFLGCDNLKNVDVSKFNV